MLLGILLAIGSLALWSDQQVEASSSIQVFIDEQELKATDPLFIEDQSLFVPVRFVAEHLGATVSWNKEKQQISVQSPMDEAMVLTLGSREIVLGDQSFWMNASPKMKDNRVYMPVRQVAELLHMQVRWEAKQSAVYFASVPLYEIQTGDTLDLISKKLNVPVELLAARNEGADQALFAGESLKVVVPDAIAQPLAPNDVDLLSRIIFVESGYESFEGQLAVGSVIMNRVNSPRFPNSLYGVIYQPGQFPPALSGKLQRITPSHSAVQAAVMVLQGENNVPGALYFHNPRVSNGSFFRSLQLVAEIGNHRFLK